MEFINRFFRGLFSKRGGAVRFVALTSLFSFLSILVLLMPTFFFETAENQEIPPFSHQHPILVAVGLAPPIENIVMVGLIELLVAYRVSMTLIVATIGILSAILHAMAGGWRAVAGLVLFSVMAYSYLVWNDASFVKRYSITVGQHMLCNLPAALAQSFTA